MMGIEGQRMMGIILFLVLIVLWINILIVWAADKVKGICAKRSHHESSL